MRLFIERQEQSDCKAAPLKTSGMIQPWWIWAQRTKCTSWYPPPLFLTLAYTCISPLAQPQFSLDSTTRKHQYLRGRCLHEPVLSPACQPVPGRPLGVAARAGAASRPLTLPGHELLWFCPVIPPPPLALGILGNHESAGASKAASSKQI